MLKYQLGKQVFGNDTVNVRYSNFTVEDNVNSNRDKIFVTLECDDVSFIEPNDKLSVTSEFLYYNSETRLTDTMGDYATPSVYSVDITNNSICFLDDKYKELPLDTITAEIVDGVVTWVFSFNNLHYYASGDAPELHIRYAPENEITISDGLVVTGFRDIEFEYDYDNLEYHELSTLLFGTDFAHGTYLDNDIISGNHGLITVLRSQVRWSNDYNQEMPSVSVNKYRVNVAVPISLKTKTDLHKDDNIDEYFVEAEKDKAVNSPIEMEKQMFSPFVVKTKNNKLLFEECTKINFNLHFRDHNGNDWTVDNSDSWVFDTYGGKDFDTHKNLYYSYQQLPSSSNPTYEEKWKRSCQSDLLGYVGFTTNDVKYQKNTLKKSFIRLSFYDSDNPASQNLLAYSTIFMDNNKLYSKFISCMNFVCYFDDYGEIVKGIKVNREVNTGTLHEEGSLSNILSNTSLTTEDIEDYRLSSQISVKGKYTSKVSSEGFYLYMWDGRDDPTEPLDIYMKVEFNHAGFGRNIPMMAPYKDSSNNKGFKTNYDIINDWDNGGYGIMRYTRYSYIHLKARYDNVLKRYIYYLDPDTYGTAPSCDGNIININLYEARITFD